MLCPLNLVYFVFSFLLGKHKAAIEVYNEAARLNQKDWVSTHISVWIMDYSLKNTLIICFAPHNTQEISDLFHTVTIFIYLLIYLNC